MNEDEQSHEISGDLSRETPDEILKRTGLKPDNTTDIAYNVRPEKGDKLLFTSLETDKRVSLAKEMGEIITFTNLFNGKQKTIPSELIRFRPIFLTAKARENRKAGITGFGVGDGNDIQQVLKRLTSEQSKHRPKPKNGEDLVYRPDIMEDSFRQSAGSSLANISTSRNSNLNRAIED